MAQQNLNINYFRRVSKKNFKTDDNLEIFKEDYAQFFLKISRNIVFLSALQREVILYFNY